MNSLIDYFIALDFGQKLSITCSLLFLSGYIGLTFFNIIVALWNNRD